MPSPTDLRDAEAVIELFDLAADALVSSPFRRHCVERLPARGRLLVTGDLHDNPVHLEKVLTLARLGESPDHHVVVHELIHGEHLVNGMDFSHRMLARIAELVLEFPGQVHPLLANHELAQMTGRGVSKGAGNSVQRFDDALEFVFGESWESVRASIHRFIIALPVALLGESGVLCAHSLPADHAATRFDLDLFERDLAPEDYLGPSGSAYLMVWGRQYTQPWVERLAARWSVGLFCVGHEHVETGIELRCGRVLVLNSDHQRAVALGVDLARPPAPEEAMLYATPLAAVP